MTTELAIKYHDCFRRKIGEHDMVECRFCDQQGHNDVVGDYHGVKHRTNCPVVAALAARPQEQASAQVAGDNLWQRCLSLVEQCRQSTPADKWDFAYRLEQICKKYHIEQASQLPEAQGVERGWLLERDRNGPEWLGINRVEAYVEWMWTKDSTKALRFARREDAENYAGFVEDCWTITEHQWG